MIEREHLSELDAELFQQLDIASEALWKAAMNTIFSENRLIRKCLLPMAHHDNPEHSIWTDIQFASRCITVKAKRDIIEMILEHMQEAGK